MNNMDYKLGKERAEGYEVLYKEDDTWEVIGYARNGKHFDKIVEKWKKYKGID